MRVSSKEFQGHEVFQDIDRLIEFYDQLSFSVLGMLTPGVRAFFNIDSYVYSSIKGTISSIRSVLMAGRINDSYSLLRKYYDSAVINIYANIFLDNECSEEVVIVDQIDGWLKGARQMPEYRVMSQYIRASRKVKPITDALHSGERYKGLRKRCNDHTHYNFFQNVLLNDNEIDLPGRATALAGFCQDLRDVAILHLGYLFVIRQHYMSSSDYVDSLECGMVPEQGSQYWVAPFVQEAFDTILVLHRPDVASIVKTMTEMRLA